MKKLLTALIFVGIVYFVLDESGLSGRFLNEPIETDSVISDAYKSRKSDLQVGGSGEVVRILSDDIEGSRHQRFILRLRSGQTLLIAHNIDLATRISHLAMGDLVDFYGEYEWNDRGGVIHWTHGDPQGRHVAGWLKHQGRTYQ